jgi:hypothetical protein
MSIRGSHIFQLTALHPEYVASPRLILQHQQYEIVVAIANKYGSNTCLAEIGPRQCFGPGQAKEFADVLERAAAYKPPRDPAPQQPRKKDTSVPASKQHMEHEPRAAVYRLPELAPEAKELCLRIARFIRGECSRGLNVMRRMPNWRDPQPQ